MGKKLLLTLLLYSLKGEAADYYQLANTATQKITEHTVCQKVTNNSGQDIFIPTKTAAQWTSFRSSTNPAGVTRTGCYPTYVGHTQGTSNGASCAANKYSGLQVGDLMITTMFNNGSLATIVPPTGFTVLQSSVAFSGGYYIVMTYKIADASDVAASSFAFTKTGSFSDCRVSIPVYRYVDTTTPIADYQGVYPAVTGTMNFLSATASAADSLSVTFSECYNGVPGGVPTGGYTADVSPGYGKWASRVLSSSGATGTFTHANSTGGPCSNRHIILNPVP